MSGITEPWAKGLRGISIDGATRARPVLAELVEAPHWLICKAAQAPRRG